MNLLLSCFGLSALCTVLANTWPCQPARHHSTTGHKACPYMDMLPLRWLRVGSILNEDELAPPPRSYLGMLYLSIYSSHRIRMETDAKVKYRRCCLGEMIKWCTVNIDDRIKCEVALCSYLLYIFFFSFQWKNDKTPVFVPCFQFHAFNNILHKKTEANKIFRATFDQINKLTRNWMFS